MSVPTRLVTVALFAALVCLGAYSTAKAKPRPIPAPPALLQARAACPNTSSLAGCRGELRKALQAVAWQKKQHRLGDAAAAIYLACDREHMQARCGEFFTVAQCESNLHPLSTLGQFKGLFQLGEMHRSDPVIRLLGWDDPYANALHTVRFVKAHGWSQWQCQPQGGLRW